jgi:hypothetical protein
MQQNCEVQQLIKESISLISIDLVLSKAGVAYRPLNNKYVLHSARHKLLQI